MNMSTSRTLFLATLLAAAALSLVVQDTSAADPAASGTGKVNAVMPADRKVNLTHDPIPALGWPGMTMDFRLADPAMLEGIEVGDTVRFTLRKAPDGMYEIESLSTADASR